MRKLFIAALLVFGLAGPASAQVAAGTDWLKQTATKNCGSVTSPGGASAGCYWEWTAATTTRVFHVGAECALLDVDPDSTAGQGDNGNRLDVYRVITEPNDTGSQLTYSGLDGSDTKLLRRGQHFLSGSWVAGTGHVDIVGTNSCQ